ncbi:PREDICTED: uncharacterized protein LOC109342929 isoform X1 [Lupinus angustifolius]|uniref:uncharacterized protein LOC109342929 isoform X1 n=1 Tax=Lupinus angustifolius TaxID=3871 RepID=UPI00092E59D1|nr:PREDICTED: uncharacterized protein LOC109342929 isoform X1 [Lupinus angustifolius]
MSHGASKKNKLPGRSSNIHSGNTRDCTVPKFDQNNSGAIEIAASQKGFASSLKAITEAPPSSLEFFVWNDEGINLCVDLNSSPSDWINKLRNEVCTSMDVNRKNSRSLRQELGYLGESSTQGKTSFLSKTNSDQIDDHTRQIESSSSLKLAKDDVTGLDQQNKGRSPLLGDSLIPCSITINVADNVKEDESAFSALTLNVADNLKEYGSAVSAEVSCGAENNYIAGSEYCAKALPKKIPDSDVTDTLFFKSRGSVGNSPSVPDKLECQNSKHGNEISEDCALLNGSCMVNPDVVYPGSSLSGSTELQISEVASCHKYVSVSLCENDVLLDLSDPKNTLDAEWVGLVNSSEEMGKIFNGRESSECSQFDDPLKKSGLESDNQDSKMDLRRKRKHRDPDIQGSNDNPPAKNLRSMKNVAVTVQPRRSMRLISKVMLLGRIILTER